MTTREQTVSGGALYAAGAFVIIIAIVGMVAMNLLGITGADVRARLGVTPAPQATSAPQREVVTVLVREQAAPVVYQQTEQAPPQIAPLQPAPVPTSAPEAPVQVAPQPAVVVVHEREEKGAPLVTGAGACAVGGNVAKRCGK